MPPVTTPDEDNVGVPASLKGMIADAQGVYHDISKHAFDAFSILHPDSKKHISNKLLEMPIVQGMHAIAKKHGIDLGDFDWDFQRMASNFADLIGSDILAKGAAIAPGAVAKAVGLIEGTVATGGVMALGVIGELAIEWAIKHWTDTADKVGTSYLKGDWVLVDKGQKTVVRPDPALAEENWEMSTMFDASVTELTVLERREDYHAGFFVAPGEDKGTVSVFDLMTGEVKEYPFKDVRLLPQDQRVLLDRDEVASKIRELYFYQADEIMMEVDVATEPGTEVIWEGSIWHIEETNGEVATIVNYDGERQHVGLAALERSRQSRHGPQYKYENGQPLDNTGFSTQPGGFGTGDWVWVDYPGTNRKLLACVHVISGKFVVLFETLTGTVAKVEPRFVVVANNEDSDTFNRIKDFALFRRAVVEGVHIEKYKIPAKYRPLVLREDPPARWEAKIPKQSAPTFRQNSAAEPVKTDADANAVDRLIELQETTGLDFSDQIAALAHKAECEVKVRRRLGFGDGECEESSWEQARKRHKGGDSQEFFGWNREAAGGWSGAPEKKEDYTTIIIGACAVGVAIYFLT